MADSDPEVSGWGGGGFAVSKKKFVRPFGPQFGLKIKGGGRVAPTLDPPLYIGKDGHLSNFS